MAGGDQLHRDAHAVHLRHLLAPEHGWSHPLVQVSLWGSLALLVAFVVIERRVARPMLALGLFRRAQFAGVQLLGASPAFAFVVLIVLLPGRFIGADGLSAVQAGQLMIALSAPLLVVPMLAALLSRWFTAGLLSALGLALNALGLLWMSVALASGPQALLLPMLVVGVGIGLPWGLMDGLAVSVVEKERAGMATGIFNTVRVSGDGVAIALVGALLAALVVAALPASGASSAQVIVPPGMRPWVTWPGRRRCSGWTGQRCSRVMTRRSVPCCRCWRRSPG